MLGLYCKHCDDIVVITEEAKRCKCNAVGGEYLNSKQIRYYGPAIAIDISPKNIQTAAEVSKRYNCEIKVDLKVLPDTDNRLVSKKDSKILTLTES